MIRVGNLDAALDFFCAKLGLVEINRFDNEGGTTRNPPNIQLGRHFLSYVGATPFYVAAKNGDAPYMRLLLDHGADINAISAAGQTAMHFAAQATDANFPQPSDDMVKFLASKDAKLNEHGKVNQWERKIIQEPRPKDMNKGGFTALHYAALDGGGAALDVYDREPLPKDDPIRGAPNTLLTPHLGYVMAENYAVSFREAVENIEAWLDGAPKRLIEPGAPAGH